MHAETVRPIAEDLAARPPGRPVSLRKNSPPHQVPKAKDTRRLDEKIDVGALDRILHIDVDRRICVAESGVTFVDLVEATLRHGLVPIVVPELETITLGGAVSGCSIESTSYKYGGFHDTCLAYEVITSEGEVLTCTPDNENALVFEMMHGSFGTLGVLSKLTFRLMPAKPFVKVRYERYDRLSDYLAAIRRHFRRAGRRLHGWDHPHAERARARRRELRRPRALRASVRLGDRLLPNHGQARGGLPPDGGLFLPLRQRRHPPDAELVPRPAPLREDHRLDEPPPPRRQTPVRPRRATSRRSSSTPSSRSRRSPSSWTGTRRSSASSRSGACPTSASRTTPGSPRGFIRG